MSNLKLAKYRPILFSRLRMLLAIILIFINADFSQARVDDGTWLRNWMLCGPIPLESTSSTVPDVIHLPGFETDYLSQHGGEKSPKVKVGQTEKFTTGTAKWFKYTSPDSIINLDQAISNKSYVLAYGYCEFNSPSELICVLALGTNDGGRLWLNGEVIWDRSEGRGLQPDDDLLIVKLRKGQNRILLKVEERGGTWGFCVRFLPFEIVSKSGQIPIFSVNNRDNGQPYLQFLQPESIIKTIFNSLQIQVISPQGPGRIWWQHNWSKEPQMPIDIEFANFKNYKLRLEGILMDGEKWQTELPFSAGKRIDYSLFENGKTDYTIYISPDASESEKWAAKELQHWVEAASGAKFPIQSAEQPLKNQEIIIGFNNRLAKQLGKKVEPPDENDESFTYQNVGPKILIWGGKARGSMYGVMSFLENELGIRWYTPSVTHVPQKTFFRFDELNHSEAPTIRVRNDFYYEAFKPIWAARNKINGAMNYREQPGGLECYWAVHTFYRFMPPDEFYEKHPEYYSLIDGKRVHDHAQLCLTNPAVLQIVTDRLKETMRKTPEYLIYSVSQNDWRNPCQCEKCQAIAQREESESGPLIWFVNQVAQAIEKKFPDKFVGTLAYQYTRKPCKTLHPRQNVVIRLCSIECCFAHDFHHCPENASFIADLQGWAEISPHLYIWDYVVNFSHYIMPYPNFRVLQPNIKTFRDNKAIGIMEQAAYQSRGGEFAELRAYVISKLLWNPECNVETVINDFMYGYYGRSGQYIRQYFDLLHNRLTAITHIHLGLRPEDRLFSEEFVQEADKIFDIAEAVADNETIRQRVEMARLPLMYLKCKRTPNIAIYDGTYSRFTEIVKREGITHYAEAGVPHRQGFHQKIESIKKTR